MGKKRWSMFVGAVTAKRIWPVQAPAAFLKVLLQEMIAFKNILRFPQILPEVAQNVKTDMELNKALKLANALKNVEFEEINTVTLPGGIVKLKE